MNRSDFQKLALEKLRDAKILLDAGSFDSAYYLAGYAVECALKACIARQTKEFDYPPRGNFYTHDLSDLRKKSKLPEPTPDKVEDNWRVVENWEPESRYDFGYSEEKVRDLIEAITDPVHGVLKWLSEHW